MIEIKNLNGKVLHTVQSDTLGGANLQDADLQGADLRGADLQGADLQGADLLGANLRDANLQFADLHGANLRCADLLGANLLGANLRCADLHGADLRGANLRCADLLGANLRDAYLPHFQIIPETGSFRAYKKLSGGVIAEVEIPADAARTSSLVGRKCRASEVLVISGEGDSPTAGNGSPGTPRHYAPGTIVKADKFDPDIRIECSHGIHFFITRKEAEEFIG